ncbi:hypothetical protein NDU88_000456 [Pleurodeles waltl]|uniref:Uncharacterized protein n=1 Tax=Pleurodeles waltl TaxID=8319 RepID=A0AAV7UQ11_PLEWA|nr:hypothetical protein NDU88_000456 [Pleurodeles waltl]
MSRSWGNVLGLPRPTISPKPQLSSQARGWPGGQCWDRYSVTAQPLIRWQAHSALEMYLDRFSSRERLSPRLLPAPTRYPSHPAQVLRWQPVAKGSEARAQNTLSFSSGASLLCPRPALAAMPAPFLLWAAARWSPAGPLYAFLPWLKAACPDCGSAHDVFQH